MRKTLMLLTRWKGKVFGVLLALFVFWLPDGALGAPKTVLLPVSLEENLFMKLPSRISSAEPSIFGRNILTISTK